MANSSLTIRTGLQGNGKTLNTIKEVDEQAHAEGRPVYFHNVTGLKPDKLKADWFEFDDPLKWFELPENSIIVVDEAQGDIDRPMFGVRDPRKAVPLHVSRFETMRKQGHEVHLITQDPRFLDVHARRLCNCHVHYWRIFGSAKVTRFQMPRVKDDVEKINTFKDAERKIITLDKKLFGVYESAKAAHHFKFKMPKAGWVLMACFVALGYLGYKLKDRFWPEEQVAQVEQVAEAVKAGGPAAAAAELLGVDKKTPTLTKAQFLAQQKPRVADLPSSAPMYDELTKPVSFPRTYCVMTEDPELIARNRKRMAVEHVQGKQIGCQCYSQQNSRVATSFAYCMDVVQNGRFDPTIPDRQQQSGGQNGPQAERPTQALNSPTQPAFSRQAGGVTVVADSEYPSRPWR